ncbi:BTAD domain-containing putative transcriptional regulator [Kitasatospora sp. NPDC036755]|uniref:BTAD domain-containing putative transcriptional regulator n=1 Tax=Kitasatospora sp. NPDC036755 TaxID=3154600 RepID=UPI003406C330
MLGPLEIIHEGSAVSLGGFNRRAILGYLLLNSGRIVSVRQVVAAVWGDGVPPTARKMTQNAISDLRRILQADTGRTAALSTRTPGYLLEVGPENLDLSRFEALARHGRAELAAGAPEKASGILREALALWRGPALADLAEAGVRWSELAAVEATRLAVFEDRVQAELSLGRHHDLVAELEAAAAAEPTRERLCGQLMLALYRCGRQPDAVLAYQRTRTALVAEFGLDPGRELQELERRILQQDDALNAPGSVAGARPVAAVRPPRPADPDRDRVDQGRPDQGRTDRAPADGTDRDPLAPALRRTVAGPAATEARTYVERRTVSAVLISLALPHHLGADPDDVDPERLDDLIKEVTQVVREQAERFGGVLWQAVNTTWTVLFGVPRAREDDPERAVHAAWAIQAGIATAASERGRRAVLAEEAPRVLVVTDDVVVTYRNCVDERPSEVTGRALLAAEHRSAHCRPGAVQVCDNTRLETARAFHYVPASTGGPGWEVSGVRARFPASRPLFPFGSRERELRILRIVLDGVLRLQRPHLLTLVGDPGIGKTRLIDEFLSGLDDAGAPVRRLVGVVPSYGESTLATLAQIVRQYTGITELDGPAAADLKLTEAVHRLAGRNDQSDWMLRWLRLCLTPGSRVDAHGSREMGLAWRHFLEEIATTGPVVLVLSGLHRADDELLDLIGELAEHAGRVPLFVIASSRPEILHKRTGWRGGKHDTGTITLERLPDDAVQQLIATVPEGAAAPASAPPPGGFDSGLIARIGGNPLFAEEFLRAGPAEGGRPQLPRRLRALVTARLDMLTPLEKAVLRDAAVIGDHVWVGAVASGGGLDRVDVANCLKRLASRGYLRPVRPSSVEGDEEYAFEQPVFREVAYGQLTRRARMEKHWRASDWLAALPADRLELLPYQLEQAVELGREGELDAHTAHCLSQRARQTLAESARRAVAQGAHGAAAACFRAAIELCPPQHPERQRLLASYRECLGLVRANDRDATRERRMSA